MIAKPQTIYVAIGSPDPGADEQLELISMVLVPQVKITVPGLPAEFVTRANLCADLDAGAAADVALVCAPPGYGKTLLLADWAQTSTAMDAAWVGLDPGDNDPRRLWSAVVAAVARCPSVPGAGRRQPPRVWRPATQSEFIAQFAAALAGSPQPIRLILDDVHNLVDPHALDSLRAFIRVKPATVRLVLASRFDPPLALPRLRLAGRLWELRAAQLSFTPPQTAALLENTGLRLSPQQVQVLHRRTGGWAAGLRLAALGLAKSGDHEAFLTQFSGDDRSVADYLVGEILGGLPADLQDFLRVTSICDPMPAALAAQLSGRDDAGSVLDRLEHETSLVTATGPRREDLPRPGTAAHPSGRGPAAPRRATGGRAARRDRPLVGRPGPAATSPRTRHPQRRRSAAHRPAAPVRPPAAPGRGPRPGAARAGRCRCTDRGGRSLAVAGRRAHPPGGG